MEIRAVYPVVNICSSRSLRGDFELFTLLLIFAVAEVFGVIYSI